MRRSTLLTTILMIALPTIANAQATVTIDVAKISCDQFVGYKITDPRYIAIWLSGYYNGKRNNTLVDTQAFNEGYEKLRNYCVVNPRRTVMQAVETLFGQ